MANERLRSTLASAGHTYDSLAEVVGVDPKTVERWVLVDRVPHARHRRATARALAREESFLWPTLLGRPRTLAAQSSEVVQVYPSRTAVPADVWRSLVDDAHSEVDILVYAGLFLVENEVNLIDRLRQKAMAGVRIQLAIGDPDSDVVRQRGIEEGIGDGLAGRIRLVQAYLSELSEVSGIEIRQHATPLYNSIYRGDSTMIVNMHTYGAGARLNPVMLLQRIGPGGLFDGYLGSVARVWASAADLAPEERAS